MAGTALYIKMERFRVPLPFSVTLEFLAVIWLYQMGDEAVLSVPL